VKIPTTLALLAIAATLVACNDDKTPTTPSPDPAPKFTATLLPINEVPPVTNAEASGSGTMTITFNLVKDSAGAITSGSTVDFAGTFSGFPNGTALTAAHIHPGAAGTNGSVLVSTAITAGEVTFPTGTGALNKTGLPLTADIANQILANPGNFYFNIHTAMNPGGVARGQLVRTQ
jgi:hypothetical protein